MKEVKLKRVTGPFDQIPFENYIQSPIGLVPKSGSDKTRLIFHLSYNFSEDEKDKSLNYHTPSELCTTKYCDIGHAVETYLTLREQGEHEQMEAESNNKKPGKSGYAQNFRPVVVYASKTDIQSAFRILPLLRKCWPWVIMAAENPCTKKLQFFVDKCLPFGASISCALFQRV